VNKKLEYPHNLVNDIVFYEGVRTDIAEDDVLPVLDAVLASLNPKERIILHSRYCDYLKLRAIGEMFEISNTRVGQIRDKALRKIRYRVRNYDTLFCRNATNHSTSEGEFATGTEANHENRNIQYDIASDHLLTVEALSVRTFNTLNRAGISSISLLLEKSDCELLGIRNFGPKCLDEINALFPAKKKT